MWDVDIDNTGGPRARRSRGSRRFRPAPIALESRRLLASPYEVTTIVDSTEAGSLRAALLLANTNASNTKGVLDVTITFDPTLFSTPQTLQLTKGALLANAPNLNLTITAPVPGGLTIQGNGSDRVLDVIGGASVSLTGLTLTGGSTAHGGGALEVLSTSSATLTDCTIGGSTARDGGGVYNSGTLNMTGCTIAGNTARYGGGFWGDGTSTLIDSTISGNSAVQGGGLLNYHPGHLHLTNDTIANNKAEYGGGLENYGRAYLTAATVTGNTADATNPTHYSYLGGGIYNYIGPYNYGSVATLNDVIVAENHGLGASFSDIGGNDATSVTGSNNLIGAGGGGGIRAGFNGNIQQSDSTKLALGNLGDYGGPTATIPLLPGSVAIGAGKAQSGVTTDQRGFALDSTPDLGAYQAVSVPLVVGATGDGGSGASVGTIDLRGAIDLAELGTSASTITFDPTTFKTPETITLAEGPLSISGTIAIDGPAAGLTVSGGGTSRVFQVGSGASATISGLTISGGSAKTGGGLYNLGSSTLQDCAIAGDSATANGGGVANLGTLDLIQCTIGNDVAGGVGGGIYSLGTASMVACTISGNTASGAAGGGGIYQSGASPAGATLSDTIVAGNAGAGGTPSEIAGPGASQVVGTFDLVGPGGSGGIGGGTGDLVLTQATGLLGPLGDYGGGTLTFPVLPGSAAIDAGSSALLPSGTSTDQRSQPRVVGASVDIGAFESQGFSMTSAAGSTPQSAMPGASFGTSLTVTVQADHAGDPVAGGVVEFAVTPSGSAGALLSSSTSTIGAGGTALVSATANGQYGSYVVTASAVGASTATFDLTNLVPVSFSGLSKPSIVFGTDSATFGGTLDDGQEIPSGQSVALTFQGTTQDATIQSDGSFQATFTNTAGLNVPGAPYTVDLSYAGDGTYGPATATTTLTVTRATPTVVVTDAGGTYTGSAFPGSATVAGVDTQASSTLEGTGLSLSYYVGRSATGTASSSAPVNVGTYTVQAEFAGSQDYAAASVTATFAIAQATPTIIWSTPAAITYGLPLGASQLDATASVGGTFSYSPNSGTVLGTGTNTLTATFTPTDTTNYKKATASVSLVVTKATPVIDWPTPSSISAGTALDGTQLDATSTVPGTFTYTPALGTILPVGTQTLSVTFAPTDSIDYTAVITTVSLVVHQPPVLTWTSPRPIVFGTALGSSQLDATANVLGTIVYRPPLGTVLHAGTQTLSATLTPDNSTSDASVTATVTLVVQQATPTITWPAPASIVYGTALGATQLDAKANVPGTFAYSVAAGTVLGVGTHPLSLTFTPSDTADETIAGASATIAVAPAVPTLVVHAGGGIYDGSPFAAVAALSGVDSAAGAELEGVAPTITYMANGSPLGGPPTAAGTYTAIAAFPGSPDYASATAAPVSFTIAPASSYVAVSVSGGSAVFGQSVVLTAAVAASGMPTGAITFLDGGTPIGTVALDASGHATLSINTLSPGPHAIAALYSGDADRSGGQSSPASISIQPAATQVVLVPHPVFRRKKLVALSLTAEVQPIAPGVGVPTGSISFVVQINRKRQRTLANLGLGGGQATLSINPRSVLNKPLSLAYTGDAVFLPAQLDATRLNPHALAALYRTAARLSHAKMVPAGPIRHRLTLR